MPPAPLDAATIRELEPFLLRLAARAVRDPVLAHDVLREADRALDAGTIRYTAMIAERLP